MSKSAIDELLDTVSGCDFEHPVFGPRYGGDMNDEEFLLAVDGYVLRMQAQCDELYGALDQAVTSMQDSGYANTNIAVRAARYALANARGES